jgi:hypothetical protein
LRGFFVLREPARQKKPETRDGKDSRDDKDIKETNDVTKAGILLSLSSF